MLRLRPSLVSLLLAGALAPSGAAAAPSVVGSSRAGEQVCFPADPAPVFPRLRRLPSARAALRAVLRQERPAVLGLGEYHQRAGQRGPPSSLNRFTRQLLPLLARKTSDLVIETWVTDGDCGATERQVVADVTETIKRPARTENEILTLIKRAQRQKIRAQILTLTCDEYTRLLAPGDVDYAGLLALTANKLRDKLKALAAVRSDPVRRAADDAIRALSGANTSGRELILVYGGALHNELYPPAEAAASSYGPAVSQATGGRFVELDLFVPEYIEEPDSLLREQPWFPLFEREQSHRHALLIQRAERSYVIIFPRQRPARGALGAPQ